MGVFCRVRPFFLSPASTVLQFTENNAKLDFVGHNAQPKEFVSHPESPVQAIAVHMKALLHVMGLHLAPTLGFRGSLALPPGSQCHQGLWKGPRGLPK